MNPYTWPGQQHRDYIIDDMDNSYLTGWRLGCPNCGEMIAASSTQFVQNIEDITAGERVYAKLTTICLRCNCPQAELWSIN